KGKLFAGSIPSSAIPARGKKGHRRRRCFDPDRRIPYAQERYSLSGFECRLLRWPGKSEASPALGRPASEPGLRRPNHTDADACMTTLFLVRKGGRREAALFFFVTEEPHERHCEHDDIRGGSLYPQQGEPRVEGRAFLDNGPPFLIPVLAPSRT